jgi:branched-chain amino acid transport system substrate-binding protein
MVLIARQASELGIAGSLFVGGDGWDSTNLLEGAAAELEGAYFTNHYAPDIPWPHARVFITAFEARFHHPPAGGSAQGYDAANMLFDAMTRAPKIERKAIRDALAQTKDLPGATGAMTVGADNNTVKPVVVVQIKAKQFHYAGEVAAK